MSRHSSPLLARHARIVSAILRRISDPLAPNLQIFQGYIAQNLQIFQGNSDANCSFSRLCRCLQLSNQIQMPPFSVWSGVDEYLGGLKDGLPDLLKKVERFKAVFG